MLDRSSERLANMREARVLRAVFLARAVTEAIALLPMHLPSRGRPFPVTVGVGAFQRGEKIVSDFPGIETDLTIRVSSLGCWE